MRRCSVALWLLAASPACIAPQPKAAAALAPVAKQCAWPGGAKAAVSLTYDDGLQSQLLYAAPVLERHGIKATFFLSGGRMADFAPLGSAGHELASHTLVHPCHADLAALSLKDMALELDAGKAAVPAPAAAGKLTFAYPCGETRVAGGESYVPLVKERFRAARGVGAAVAEPQSVELFHVPALFPPSSSDGSDAIAFVERAVATGGWAVIGLHGVSQQGEYLQLSQPAHDSLVQYLAEHAKDIWTAPFGAVADVVAACQSAAGK